MAGKESSKPLYQTIVERLSREIAGGHYQPGQKFPSEAALVKKFNVSRITVTRAVRELQQLGLVDRVAGSGTYVRNQVRRRRENLLFGLIIPNLGDTEIFEPICQGIAASPEASGHGLLWGQADSRAASKEEQALQLCQQCIARGVSGVFFAPLELSENSAEVNRKTMKLLKKAGIPLVLLDRRPHDETEEGTVRERCDLVGIDNQRAGYLAAEHLLRLGARRLGFVAYQNQASTVKARIRGFQDALSTGAAAGKLFVVRPADRLELPAAALGCDAFVCANDRIAGRLMQTLLARGLRIPHDVRLVGIDDAGYADLLPVPLTTVHQPCREIGEAALRVMLERLDRPQMPARDILLDCRLIVRQSCGAAGASAQRAEI